MFRRLPILLWLVVGLVVAFPGQSVGAGSEPVKLPQARILTGHAGAVRTLDFSSDGTRVVTGGQDGTARIWDAANGKNVAVYRPPSLGDVLREVAPTSPFVSVLTDDPAPPKGQWSNGIGPYGEVVSVQFSPDSKRILFLGRTNNMGFQPEGGKPYQALPFIPARILDAATGKLMVSLPGDRAEPLSAAFSSDGKRVVIGDGMLAGQVRFNNSVGTTGHSGGGVNANPVARVHDAISGKEICRLPHKLLLGAVFTPEGDRVVTHGVNCVRVWQLPAGKKLWHLGYDFQPQTGAGGWDGDQPRYFPTSPHPGSNAQSMPSAPIASGPLGPLGGPALPTLNPNAVYTPAAAPVPSPGVNGPAVVSPDGKRLFVQHPARILDLATGKEVCRLEGSIGLLPEISLSGAGQALRWSGQQMATGPAKVSPFSPDGRWVVAPTDRNAVAIWDVSIGKVACQLRGHLGLVIMARFSADGRLVVTVSEDQTARVWHAATGKELHTLTGHEGAVLFAAFSPDGKRLATAGADGTARIWELDLLALAAARRPRELTPEERQRYEVGEDK